MTEGECRDASWEHVRCLWGYCVLHLRIRGALVRPFGAALEAGTRRGVLESYWGSLLYPLGAILEKSRALVDSQALSWSRSGTSRTLRQKEGKKREKDDTRGTVSEREGGRA